MNEFIEKLIGRLEEQVVNRTFDESIKTKNLAYKEAIEIVDQLAEEYKEQNIDQDLMIVASLPSLYPMMQPFEVEAIDRVVSSAKHSGGWIPCSKELPVYLDNVLVCTENGGKTIAHLKHTPNEWRDMYMNKIDDFIAWQPLPVPFKE